MAEEPPTTWELMRAMTALRDSVDKLAAGMVTQSTLAIIQQAQKDGDDRRDARIRDLEKAIDERAKERVAEQAEQRKQRSQMIFAMSMTGGGALLAAVFTIVTTLILRGIPS